jgi:hypothetical protein
MIRFALSMPPRCPTRPYWRPGAVAAPTQPTRRKRGYAGLARQSDHAGERGPDAPGQLVVGDGRQLGQGPPGQLFVVRNRAHGTAGRCGGGAQVSVVAECDQRTQGDGDGPENDDHRHHWCPHALAGREGTALERCFAGRQRGRRAGRQPTPTRVAGRATRPIHTPRGVGHQGRAHQATTKPPKLGSLHGVAT